MGINDQMASMVLGELDGMTKTIEATVTHLDAQLIKLSSIEARIEQHVGAIATVHDKYAVAPQQSEVLKFWQNEFRGIAAAGRVARQEAVEGLVSAIHNSVHSAHSGLRLQSQEAFRQAAEQFKESIKSSAEFSANQANLTHTAICTNLKTQAESLIQYHWIAMIGTSIVASILASIVTVYILK